MCDNCSKLSSFEELLVPLDILIMTVFHEFVVPELLVLINSHKEDIISSPTAKAGTEDILISNSKHVIKLINKNYRKKILEYYNTDGLSLYVISNLKRNIHGFIEHEKSENPFKKATGPVLTQ